MSNVCKEMLEDKQQLEQEIKELFDKIDTDHSNEIDKKVASTNAKKFFKI